MGGCGGIERIGAGMIRSVCMARSASNGHILNKTSESFAFWSMRVYNTLISNI